MPDLDTRARNQIIPEPVVFTAGPDGVVRFLAPDALPWRALIDLRAGSISGVRVDAAGDGIVTITDGEGHVGSWRRSAVTLDGTWVCDLLRA